jgi:hypothetical protein
MNRTDWANAVTEAVAEISLVKYFPADPDQRVGICKLILRMVEFGRVDQLAWLVRTMVGRIGVWNGPVELRGVFATKFKPADGIEANCIETPGFTPSDLESRATAPKLLVPEARALLAGVIEANESEDVQALIDSIARMPGPIPNARGGSTPIRTDRERDQVAESVKDQLQPARRRPLTPEGRARLAAFYAAQVEELGAAELETPPQAAAGSQQR